MKTFYSLTSMNQKYEVKSYVEISEAGRNFGGSNVVEYKGETFFNLPFHYWVNKKTLDLIIAKFSQHHPKNIRTDFNIFDQNQLSATEMEEFSFDIDKALQEFVSLLETKVEKKDILDKCLELYKMSLTSETE